MNIIPKSSDDKSSISSSDNAPNNVSNIQYKGQMAFADCEIQPITDLFLQYARRDKLQDQGGCYLTIDGVKELLSSIGERRNDETVAEFFQAADLNNDGKLHLHEFLRAADQVLSKSPARIVLVSFTVVLLWRDIHEFSQLTNLLLLFSSYCIFVQLRLWEVLVPERASSAIVWHKNVMLCT